MLMYTIYSIIFEQMLAAKLAVKFGKINYLCYLFFSSYTTSLMVKENPYIFLEWDYKLVISLSTIAFKHFLLHNTVHLNKKAFSLLDNAWLYYVLSL